MPREIVDEAPDEIRTAEAWAEAKGFLPQMLEAAAPFGGAGAPKTVTPNPQFWKFAGAKASWPVGKELTEAEFDAAIEAAGTCNYR